MASLALKMLVWACCIAVGLLLATGLAFVGYNLYYEQLATRDHERCMRVRQPTTLAWLKAEFGPVEAVHKLPSGNLEYYLQPSPMFARAYSEYIYVEVDVVSGRVITMTCGEGYRPEGMPEINYRSP